MALDATAIVAAQLKRKPVRQRPSGGSVKHVFDHRQIPQVATLLVAMSLGYLALVPAPRESDLLVGGVLIAIVLGGVGASLLLLRWRWSYGRLFAVGALVVFVEIGIVLVAFDALRFLIEPLLVVFVGLQFAGGWHFFCGPFVIDKSSAALSNKR